MDLVRVSWKRKGRLGKVEDTRSKKGIALDEAIGKEVKVPEKLCLIVQQKNKLGRNGFHWKNIENEDF
eukprot:scaffold486_cov79-Cylindrotheca_fusiformis.AAC.3